MKNLTYFVYTLCAFFFTTDVSAQLASWSLQSDANPTFEAPGITASAMVLGTGVIHQGYNSFCGGSGCSGRRVRGWTTSPSGTSIGSQAVPQNKYVQFSITATGTNFQVESFTFTSGAGFTTNCTGQAPSTSLRWSKDAGAYQWIRNGGACAAEYTFTTNSGNNGACVTRTINAASHGACGTSTFPIIVNQGETVNFRIYIATTHSSSWHVLFGDVSVSGGYVLPIELLNFKASLNNDKTVHLNWTTSTETNNDYFTIERSRDMENWEEVSKIRGAGNSNTNLNYNEIDTKPFEGVSYYRLKQTDFDGSSEYSPTVYVKNSKLNSIELYPNPVSRGDRVYLSFDDMDNETMHISIRDLQGKEVVSYSVADFYDTNEIEIPIGYDIPAGMYLITATSENRAYRQKLLID